VVRGNEEMFKDETGINFRN